MPGKPLACPTLERIWQKEEHGLQCPQPAISQLRADPFHLARRLGYESAFAEEAFRLDLGDPPRGEVAGKQ
jgi:hypothetical protein